MMKEPFCDIVHCEIEVLDTCTCGGQMIRTHHHTSPWITGREPISHWTPRVEYERTCKLEHKFEKQTG